MLVAFFFLLLDGKRLVNWIATVAPLPGSQILEIFSDFRSVSVAVLRSSLGTAGVQSIAALIGYVAASVPQPLFFTLVTFVVAFIPAIGAASVVLAAAGLLFFTGHNGPAAYLAIWGIVVVSTVDNVVKPWLLKGQMEIHAGLIFFALVGGLATFGPAGLVAGPLILSFFLAVVRLNRNEPHHDPGVGPAPA
jgi:predicted PurR-regulated permease PerM